MRQPTAASTSAIFAELALLPGGWAHDVRIGADASGTIVDVITGAAPDGAVHAKGALLPGMPNVHSHAFQRAMAGEAERGSGNADFWSWRDVMYRFAARITPEHLEPVATQLYVEMLQAGYTSVVEFHYLHHDPDGRPYADRLEMAHRLIAAARTAGIGLTLLPALYVRRGFGSPEPSPEQRRFVTSVTDLMEMIGELGGAADRDPDLGTGLALHSLRAVPPAAIGEAVAALDRAAPAAPVHMHVAEQRSEVDECLAATGRRPIDWLLDEIAAGPRWCFVHATHATDDELRRLAGSGVIAGLCPTTEANLGDGVFPLERFVQEGGRFGIGSDSHVSLDVREELRWLEYGQRLRSERRSVSATQSHPHSGESLWLSAVAGGAATTGRQVGAIAAGHRADFVVADTTHPSLAGAPEARLLDRLVFSATAVSPIRDVIVGGRWVVRERQHPAAETSAAAYRTAVRALIE